MGILSIMTKMPLYFVTSVIYHLLLFLIALIKSVANIIILISVNEIWA